MDDRRPVDAVVVLGAAQYDGTPARSSRPGCGTPRRSTRTASPRASSPPAAAGPATPTPRPRPGRRYLIERGVPAGGRGRRRRGLGHPGQPAGRGRRAPSGTAGTRALVVSDPWHSLRARTMARDSGLTAWTSPTRSGPVVQTRETQARYIVRETAALLYYRLTHASVDTETSRAGLTWSLPTHDHRVPRARHRSRTTEPAQPGAAEGRRAGAAQPVRPRPRPGAALGRAAPAGRQDPGRRAGRGRRGQRRAAHPAHALAGGRPDRPRDRRGAGLRPGRRRHGRARARHRPPAVRAQRRARARRVRRGRAAGSRATRRRCASSPGWSPRSAAAG